MSEITLETAYVVGWNSAAEALAAPYGEAVFTPLDEEQVRSVVAAMNAMVPHASERMHAQWARHWAQVLRDTAETGMVGVSPERET